MSRGAWAVRQAVACAATVGTILLLAAGASAATPLERAPKRLTCPPASPIAQSRLAVAFTYRWNLYGCLRGGRRPRLLQYGGGPFSMDGEWSDVVVEGTMIAYSYQYIGRCGGILVGVADMRTKRLLWQTAAGSFSSWSDANGCSSQGGTVHAISLREDGAAAFVAGSPGDYELTVVERGTPRAVARGADIDPVALFLTASTVSWWQGAVRHSAPVAVPPA